MQLIRHTIPIVSRRGVFCRRSVNRDNQLLTTESTDRKKGRARKRKVENGRKTWEYTLKEVFGAGIALKLYIPRLRILNGQLSGREQNARSSINNAEEQ